MHLGAATVQPQRRDGGIGAQPSSCRRVGLVVSPGKFQRSPLFLRFCSLKAALLFVVALVPLSGRCAEQALTLWYRTPATRWLEALPVGNGRLGGIGGAGRRARWRAPRAPRQPRRPGCLAWPRVRIRRCAG